MKARIKATGECVEVKMHYPEFERPYFTLVDSDGVTRFLSEDLEPAEPDWQHYRIQAAIAAMQAELTNPNNVFSMCEDKQATIVRRAVRYADELIAELQKKGEKQ